MQTLKDNEIRIAGTEYSLQYKSYEIYVQGCFRHCPNCHNPETQPFNGGTLVDMTTFLSKQAEKVAEFGNLVDRIYVTGGDLLCSPKEKAIAFSGLVRFYFPDKELWLFTGGELENIPEEVKQFYDVIKCGEYKEDLKQEGLFPATSNQRLAIRKGIAPPGFHGEIIIM